MKIQLRIENKRFEAGALYGIGNREEVMREIRVRIRRISISYQYKRFSRIDRFDGSKMLVTFCDLRRELH